MYSKKRCDFWFGTKKNAFYKEQFISCTSSQELLDQAQFNFLKNYGVQALIVCDQMHDTEGLIIASENQGLQYQPYSCKADYIITNVPNIALGVATADCLPIIFYDPSNGVVAVVHAGWQGTVNKIACAVVEKMCSAFASKPENIQVFFGPCASVETYEVGADFVEKVGAAKSAIIERGGKFYFDLIGYNRQLLEKMGVTFFNYENVCCTITNHAYCSYRREKELALRQMSVVVLTDM